MMMMSKLDLASFKMCLGTMQVETLLSWDASIYSSGLFIFYTGTHRSSLVGQEILTEIIEENSGNGVCIFL